MNESAGLRRQRPERYRKTVAIGTVCGLIGAGVGAYISLASGRFIYLFLCAAGASLLGDLLAFLFNKKIPISVVERFERSLRLAALVGGYFLAVAGLLVFMVWRDIFGLLSAVFFAAGATYLLVPRRS